MSPSRKRQVLKELAQVRSEHELCGDCGKPVVRAVDEKYGTEKVLEETPRTGKFLIRGGKAVFWGPWGGEYSVHVCPSTEQADES